MLKTKDGFEIVPLVEYDNDQGKNQADTEAILKKNGVEYLTPNEWIDLDDATLKALETYRPCRLRTPHGLVVRGGGFGGCRFVLGYGGLSSRFGVVGVRRKKHTHKFVKQKAKCKCGVEKDA